MLEREIQLEVREDIGTDPELLLLRNHVGRVQDQNGTWHAFGLGKGSPDLVGILRGRFFGLELKREKGGRFSREQILWRDLIRRFGGWWGSARSAAEAREVLEAAKADAVRQAVKVTCAALRARGREALAEAVEHVGNW